MESVEEMNQLYAAIMSSSCDQKTGVLLIENSSSFVAIEEGVQGRSEILFTSRREEEPSNENTQNHPPYVEKREREIASSDSDLTPKRTNFGDDFGDTMDVEAEK